MGEKIKHAQTRSLSSRWLLLTVNGLVLLIPILALLGLKFTQVQSVRETEVKLIAESVLIAEAWRGHWLEAQGKQSDKPGRIRPDHAKDERYHPINPMLEGDWEVSGPAADPTRYAEDPQGPAWRAGKSIKPLLDRAKIFNLTAARVLNAEGAVVASTGLWWGAYLNHLPEVKAALAGRYQAVARHRVSDEPKPAFSSISLRGDIRVFTALPIFSDGEVVGAVWMSRTSMDPLKAAWFARRPLSTAFVVSLFLTLLVSLLLSRLFTRPLRAITKSADAIARGESGRVEKPKGLVPTEIHSLAEALDTMTRQLSDRAEYISDFAANVSHELKSPITSIQGAAELLREEGTDMPAEQRERFLANILADASRMERLVVRLLELARIQSAPENAASVDINTMCHRLAEATEVDVELDLTQAPEKLSINPDHLEGALRNLLDNAARHGGGQAVKLKVSSEADGRVAFAVSDLGPGISPANQKRIFDRFFTTERDRGGTGLGLAIVQAVARTRSGDVRLDTGPEGSTFTLLV
ncbi:MAG: HAMP domain-containing protein [Deltaproteobacteria bacterium]|nr:HAMP domain-containing protein [Deltaproteobacteria bacterium]